MLKKLLKIFKSKTPIQKMYPELEEVGGLQNAIDIEFKKFNSNLRVTKDSELEKTPLTFALIKNGEKFSQVYIGAEEKLYLPDFWKEGVCLANGWTKNISDLVQVLDFWLCNDVTTSQLVDKFSFVKQNDNAFAFDDNKEVEYTWNSILQNQSDTELKEFVKLAIKDDVLSKLFPFTSLYTLCFSRCTGYPYDTYNLPNVTPKEFENFLLFEGEIFSHQDNINIVENLLVVTVNKNKYLGGGDAEEALRIIKENLPENVTQARKGTAG